ncbi:uncharacterized protein LOC124198385 [Daphnia pulex]|uniref:uncharacterized protein LOC124198385 n=1 Tax=Daphnia pulex TaxID=6669 RepID=UPI001EDEBBBB|nr:uncharacterized protein LOC124198385 [Daphnia pulex]
MLYGLGGGEAAYKDALSKLKATCGSRPMMRAAHLQAIERVEAPKGDPTSFRRYAEKVRTHLFNLSCIGETGHADIIERLAQKLPVYDRLSWNDGRRGGLENRTMNTFGMWLCARASSYQNAYSVAADQNQRTSGPGKPGHQHPQQPAQHFTRRNARTHHGASTLRDVACRDAKSHHAVRSDASLIAFGVIQLEALSASGEVVPVTVMVDPGSNSTLFREGLARSLKLRGRSQTLRIDGVAGAISTLQSEHLEIRIKTAFGEFVTLKGSTLPVVTRPVPFFKWESLRERWRHLDDLPELRPAGGRIDVLIGLDHSTLITPTESRMGSEVEPVAEKTRLGWIVKDVINESGGRARVHQALASTDIGVQLLDQMRRFCDTESFGTEHHAECISPANKEAIELMERYTIKLPVGYEVPVLWKGGVPPLLPDNRSLAEARLQGTKNFDEGYARRLTPEEAAAQPAYYLPHFGVPKSPGSSELRLVYDSATKYQGSCLNDYITSRPALQNPLPAVIIRFREGAVAWSADVGAMYSRIRLNAADRLYHRFMWPEEDGSITTCEMTRVMFGVSCSPFVSIRTMWRVAEDSGPELKGATEAIQNCFYVDDYLGSVRSTEEAFTVTTTVSRALACGDFHLGGWASNDPAVLDAIQPACRVKEKMDGGAQDLGADELETVLGITWRPSSDLLGFRVKEKEVIFTRVGLASMVAGQFDPQGTAAPMTIKGKIRLRELGVRGLDWTESVNEKDREWWAQYFQTIQQLKDVEFPRCLFEEEEDIVRSELHTFADASEEACAAVCYLRNCYKDGRVIVRHVKAATKLAPLKTVSVCKLELTAALLGVRLTRFVKQALTRKMDAHFYWTDSSTVRNWVRATSAQYQVYVSHRIGEIQTLTQLELDSNSSSRRIRSRTRNARNGRSGNRRIFEDYNYTG